MSFSYDTIEQIVKLTGQALSDGYSKNENYQKLKKSLESCNLFDSNDDEYSQSGIGYSQFNELLLTLDYDRVTKDFFVWLFGNDAVISDFESLELGVEKFRKTSMLLYGNIKYAFKHFSRMRQVDIEKELELVKPLEQSHYIKRHKPLHTIKNIPPEKAYYLGYIIGDETRKKLQQQPENKELKEQQKEIERYCQIGEENHNAYLVSDHMDVYIATSMREPYEFRLVNSFATKLFQEHPLKPLKIRYFDPTQAYCKDRIDKGIVEGLMLKRARCTIYHIQESDTFGKDSELAATLAQGKPVIAFIPEIPELNIFKKDTLEQIEQSFPGKPIKEGLLKRLQRYYPEGAWKKENQEIRDWIENKSQPDVDKIITFLHDKVTCMYDKRAKTLIEDHPLSLQVNLSTGVSNGVLVVRSVSKCALLLRKILLNQMEFNIEEEENYIFLRERISKCIYRVTTGDRLLTNAFWNFYLETR